MKQFPISWALIFVMARMFTCNRLLCESSPAVIMVDGQPRARSLQSYMTRREGTSTSNSLCATGQFGKKMNRAQVVDSHRKIDIARDPTNGFGSRQVKPAHVFMESTMVQTRSHETFVIDNIFPVQGPAWMSIFAHGPENRGFDEI